MPNVERVKLESFLRKTAGARGRLFTVVFTKKDNTTRTMNCRLGVKKDLKGVGNAVSLCARSYPYVIVYDVHKKDYRMINLNTVQVIRACGGTFTVVH